jgi:hypothetical protein
MKKVDEFMENIDKKVETNVMPYLTFFKKYFTIFSASLLTILLFIFIFRIINEKPYHLAAIIKSDLDQIEKALTEIDTQCDILQLTSDRVPVDFLNIIKFEGSTVCGINLAFSNRWKGPYLKRNPMLQGKFYELIKTKYGYYLIPGNKVTLPNGYIVGKDFSIDTNTQIDNLTKPNGYLNYRGTPLARKIKFIIGDWSYKNIREKTIKKIDKALKEFNDAMPYAQNDSIKTSV